jgi:hypothetical protein
MIVLVVMEELERHFLDVHQIEENLWTLGSREKYYGSQQHDRTLAMSVGVAPGGAYSHYGRLTVGDAEVVFSTKTVWGIMRHQHRVVEHHFEYCEREFPDNLIAFVKLAARNAQRCFSLSHSRMWDRRRRDIQRSRV